MRSGSSHSAEACHDFTLDWVSRWVGSSERRLVTVLCCALSPSLTGTTDDAQTAIEPLRAAKQAARGIIEENGGHVIASAGSRLMAVWGYPLAHATDTRQALTAATAIRSALPPAIGARVSLDVGLVMIEPRSGFDSTDAELTGPVIDAAHVMLSECPIGCIVASTTARRLADGQAEFRLIDPDLPSSAALYELIEIRPCEIPAEPGRLFGHDTARAQLRACLSHAGRGIGGRGLLVEGEAGIGKSSIVREARFSGAVPSQALWIEAVCQHETRTIPLAPVQRALNLALLSPNAGEAAIRGMLAVRARLDSAEVETLVNFLSAGGARMPIDPRHRTAGKVRPMDLVVEAILALASKSPVVLVFEDVQWADSATRELVERLASQLDNISRLCLVVTSREALAETAKLSTALRHITLQRLFHDQIIEIVAARPETRNLSRDALSAIAQQAEGVPLYAIELVRYHAQTGGSSANPIALDSPSNLQLVFSARLDQLSELKPLVQAAAILGRRFDTALLAGLVGTSPNQLAPALAGLVDCGIVEQEHGASVDTFHFSHSLLRDAAYTTIPREMRVSLHRRAAELLTRSFEPGGDIAAELIAAHHERAGDYAEAFGWWRSAADAAIAISESVGAIAHLNAALAASERASSVIDVAQRLDAMRLRALQLCVVHGNASPEGVEAFRSCLTLTEQRRDLDDGLVFDVLWGLQSCHLVRGDITDALAIGERLMARVSSGRTHAHQLLATRINALTLLLAGRLTEAVAGLTDVIDSYQIERDARLRFDYGSDQRALALTHRAWALTIMGRTAEAAADRITALKAIRLLNHPHTTAHVTCVLATVAETAGEREIASAMAASGRMVADQHGFHYWSAWADLVIGAMESYADPARGAAVIGKAIEDYQHTGARQALPYAFLLLARALYRCDQPAAAAEALGTARRIAETGGLTLYAAEIRREMAALLAANGDQPAQRGAATERDAAALIATQQGAALFARRALALHLPHNCLQS